MQTDLHIHYTNYAKVQTCIHILINVTQTCVNDLQSELADPT